MNCPVDNAEAMAAAAHDLRFLLARGYPRPGSLTFVGNHYQLPKEERQILQRGVFPGPEAEKRRAKLIDPEMLAGRPLNVDGHNVLITLESALLGRCLIKADDGVIRDIAGLHRSYRPSDTTEQALDLILNYLDRKKTRSVVFILTAQLSLSGELAAQVNAVLGARGIMGRAVAHEAADARLRSSPGIIATSDSAILDRAAEPFDLAGNIIREWMPEITPLVLT